MRKATKTIQVTTIRTQKVKYNTLI